MALEVLTIQDCLHGHLADAQIGQYLMPQSTYEIDAVSWQVFQAIIADSDGNGKVDTNGLFKPAQTFLDMPTKFSRSDTVSITNPADVIEFVLKDMGVPAGDIDTGVGSSFETAKTIYTGWGLTFNGAFYYKQPRTQVLSTLLTMCHSTLRITEKVELHVLSKTSQKTITKADILRQDRGESTFSHMFIRQEYSDSGYIAFQEADESQDEFLKVIVPAKASETKISGEILTIPFVQDSQDAQRIGTLHYQRKFLKEANIGFTSKGTLLALQPDDVVTINDADYGGNFDVVVDTMFINRDLSIEVRLIKYSVALDDWGDLAPGAITIYSDDTGTYWAPIISGPTGGASVGEAPSILPGNVIIGDATNNILLDQNNMRISLRTDALADWQHFNERLCIGNLNGFLDYSSDLYGIAIGSTNEYFKYDPTNGIRISGTGTVVSVLGGGDIVLIGSDTDPGVIRFKGSTYSAEIGPNANGDMLNIAPTSDGNVDFYIGSYDAGWLQNRFDTVNIFAQNHVQIAAIRDSSNDYAWMAFSSYDTSPDKSLATLQITSNLGPSITSYWICDNDNSDAEYYVRVEANGATYAQIKVYDDGTNPYVELDAESVRMPRQPAFCAYPSANQTNIAVDATIDIAFATERYDQGNDFATPSFTAPVDGRYSFSAMIRLEAMDTAANYYQVYLLTSNETYEFMYNIKDFGDAGISDFDYQSIPVCIDADMNANDGAKLQITQNGGAQQTDISVNSWFSGHLIG